MAGRIVITRWGLDSYLEHRQGGLFDLATYRSVLRPDILLLRSFLAGAPDPKFLASRIWGPAQGRNGKAISDGYKMKWHNFGNGRVQFRLCVAIIGSDACLCHAYIKTSPGRDLLMAASLQDKITLIRAQTFDARGDL